MINPLKHYFIRAVTVAGLLFAVSVQALTLRPDAPERYVVKKGDTLWDISERFVGQAWQWPEIWYQNRQIKDPHLIYPGDVLGLIRVNGEVRVSVISRGSGSRTVKLNPSTRVLSASNAIDTIPMESIRSFLRGNRIIDQKEFAQAPRVIAGQDGYTLMGAGSRIYARGKFKEPEQAYTLHRKNRLYKDPLTDEVLGFEALDLGKARTLSSEDDIITLMLDETYQQITVGDRLLKTEDKELVSRLIPRAPEVDIDGRIIAVSGGVSQVGQFDVVVINRGTREGLEIGHVLDIKKAGEVVFDKRAGERVRLPAEKAGTLMVFRTFEKLSYALVMKATRPLKVNDYFGSPRSRR